MKKNLQLAVFLLAAPVLALLVTFLCEHKLNVELRKAIVANRSDVTPAEVQAVTVRRLLADQPASEFRAVRVQVRHFDLMRIGALSLVGIVALYYTALWMAGQLAVRNRTVLLRIFKPGYYASSVLLAGTTVANAALLMSAIYYGESYLIGAVHVKIMGLIGIGALVGAFAVIKALVKSGKESFYPVFGKVLAESDHPRIWGEIRNLSTAVGSLAPENIVLGLDPTFFVTEGSVACLDGPLHGRTMFISAPLCRVMEERHFRAIAGHELGHFKGKDTEFSRKFYPVYQGLITSLDGLGNAEGMMFLAVLPTVMMLSTFLESFGKAESKLSRERELAADSVAVSVTDGPTFAVGLVRCLLGSHYWPRIDDDCVATIRGGHPLPNVSEFIAGNVSKTASPEYLSEAGKERMAHPTDSHPPLGMRLEAAGVALDDIRDEVLRPIEGPPALDLIDSADETERELTKAYRESLSNRFFLANLPED